jgi:chromosome segregation ATPase
VQERDTTKQKMSSIDFTYSLPSPNFDRGKVKGLVATLISLKPEDYNKSTALEITAGAKLYNVVVQDEHVGKELLQNGKLKKRVTLIPLNKINAFKMSAQVRFSSLFYIHLHGSLFSIEATGCDEARTRESVPRSLAYWLCR